MVIKTNTQKQKQIISLKLDLQYEYNVVTHSADTESSLFIIVPN